MDIPLHKFHLDRKMADALLVLVLLGVTLAYWVGIPTVPFHPDETSWIVMSSDMDQYLQSPASLVWQPANSDPMMEYRLLNAPLAKYLIGISRLVAGMPVSLSDWNWSLTWDENVRAGALPSDALLLAARTGAAVLFPFSLLLLYFTGLRLGGRWLGWSAMLLMAGNALVLIHTRRAMAEGALLFSSCLFLACLVGCRKRAWLIAIPAALAFCAKHSALPFAGVGAFAILLYAKRPLSIIELTKDMLKYLVVFTVIVVLLNPFMWAHPVQAVRAAISARQVLQAEQTNSFLQVNPDSVLNTPGQVALSILANLFITPPAIADVGNYLAQTQSSAQAYLSNPFNQILRGFLGGGLLLILTFAGFIGTIRRSLSKLDPQWKAWSLVSLAGILQFLALAVTITLPFQRYILPLVPFTCLWSGWVVAQLPSLLHESQPKPLTV